MRELASLWVANDKSSVVELIMHSARRETPTICDIQQTYTLIYITYLKEKLILSSFKVELVFNVFVICPIVLSQDSILPFFICTAIDVNFPNASFRKDRPLLSNVIFFFRDKEKTET